MKRLQFFLSLKNHALRHKDMANFNAGEIEFAEQFILANANLPPGDYVQLVQQLDIKDQRVRQRLAVKLWSCLLEAASMEYNEDRNK